MADVTQRRSTRSRREDLHPASAEPDGNGLSRRRFIGYLIAAPTLVTAADLIAADPAAASIPTTQPVDFYDLTDLLTQSTEPTWALIKVVVNADGTVSFALPRAEVGQGITTATAMTIADEMGLPLSKVNVTLADATPDLVFNQFTGGSNSMHSIFTQVRVAAAIARHSLLDAAAALLGGSPTDLSIADGVVRAPGGGSVSLGELAQRAAASTTRTVQTLLKPASQFTLVGTRQPRIDAREIVTGTKQFAMDINVPGALPTMVCRPPTINGAPSRY
jgi:isoquinoline 1-oxidoreductase subunit beta